MARTHTAGETLRLAVVDTHPIQYRAPLLRQLASREGLEVKAFFHYAAGAFTEYYDEGFGQKIKWDIPLLEGYNGEAVFSEANITYSLKQQMTIGASLWKKLHTFAPDAILLVGMDPQIIFLYLWARLVARGIPMICLGESNLKSRRDEHRSRLNRAGLRYILEKFAACLYIGQENRRFLEAYGVPPEKLFFTPYAVDNARFQASYRRQLPLRGAWLKELDLPSDNRGFIFCGKFTPKKRVVEIMQAYADSGLDRDCHLIMVGSGPLETRLKQLVQEKGLKRVRFLGFVNQMDMPKVYTLADFLVLVSAPTETWGLVVNEAMTCGLPPIVAETCGCARDLVIPGYTGWKVSLDDSAALSRAMVQAASLTSEQYVQMSTATQQHISKYSFEAMVDGIIAAMRFCLGNKEQEC